jgi:hypothetical protein
VVRARPGRAIVVTNCRDAEHEAEWVATKIAAHKFEHRTRFSDYAILYRGNHQARLIEQQLRDHRIPYVMSGGQSFFDKAEIKDIIAYLRLLANEDDDPAFIRAVTTPRRGIGGTTLEALGAYAGERHSSLFAAVFEEGLDPAPQRQAAAPRAGVLRLHQPPRVPRRRASPPRSCWKTCSRHRLRSLAVRALRRRARRKPSGATCATSSAGWAGRARRTARTCSNSRRPSR